jgi:hypothetical protein
MAEAGPSDLIVVVPAFALTPWVYYFKGPQAVMPMLPKEFLNPSALPAGGYTEDTADLAYWQGRLKSLSAASPTLWLVVTKPMPEHAAKRLDAILAGAYRYVRHEDFRYVEVVKYVRSGVKP